MNKLKIVLLVIFSLTITFRLSLLSAQSDVFWDKPRSGANFFNHVEKIERLHFAKEFGVSFIRLAPNKWSSSVVGSKEGDFLIGQNNFRHINQEDVKLLKDILDKAEQSGTKVVLTMLDIPGGRWKQHNNGKEERTLWTDFEKQKEAISFWKQLASTLKGHPAVVALNIKNEPSPELANPTKMFSDWYTGNYEEWYSKIKDTPADLNLFYQKIVAAIREVDTNIFIVLDSGFYGTPWGFKILKPIIDDHKILYSFHMYEPYAFTSKDNRRHFSYPGKIPLGEKPGTQKIFFNKKELESFLQPVIDWQQKYNIPSNRILVGEVGVYRRNKGAAEYLKDTISIFKDHKWHWAFYAFREDTWDGMDYELGGGSAGENYWNAIDKGEMPKYKKNDFSEIIRSSLY
ncbi:MAG: cellulase family glycosylhydrolase [Oligoflexia bacterium]|nr:cellulase family glycosylhydrolase [Oligoflexia bacterium]